MLSNVAINVVYNPLKKFLLLWLLTLKLSLAVKGFFNGIKPEIKPNNSDYLKAKQKKVFEGSCVRWQQPNPSCLDLPAVRAVGQQAEFCYGAALGCGHSQWSGNPQPPPPALPGAPKQQGGPGSHGTAAWFGCTVAVSAAHLILHGCCALTSAFCSINATLGTKNLYRGCPTASARRHSQLQGVFCQNQAQPSHGAAHTQLLFQ